MVEPEPEVRLPYDNIMSLLGDLEYREYDSDLMEEAFHLIGEDRLDSLQELVKQLKKCHACGHVRRFDLIQEIQRDVALWHCIRYCMDQEGLHANADLWVMHDEGLADLVMDIASEKSIYVLDGGVQETYLNNVHSVLYGCLCGYLRMVTKGPESRRRYLKATKSFLERANRLCMMLWSNRDQTLSVMTDTSLGRGPMRSTMCARMLSLTYSVIKLHHACYKQVQQLTYGRAYHVAMYVWTQSRNLSCCEAAWRILSIGIGEQGPVIGSGPDHNHVVMRQFLEESVIKTNQRSAVVAKMAYLLGSRYIFHHILAGYLSIFHMMVVACPAILQSLPPTSLVQLRTSCSIAFQRQVCSENSASYVIMAFTYEVLKTSFYVISFTWDELFEAASAGRMTLAMATAFWKEAVRMKLLPLMQALFRLRITQERANKDFLTIIGRLMTICKAAAARLALESQISKPTFNLLHTVVVFMQSVWYPVREYLAPVEERPKDRYQIWIPVAALWDELGFACGLSLSDPDIEDPEPWSEQILNLGDERFSRVGCSWPDCLCSLSPHHGMKICKGCWQARYCSRECQEMDWCSGRHRDECSRNRRK